MSRFRKGDRVTRVSECDDTGMTKGETYTVNCVEKCGELRIGVRQPNGGLTYHRYDPTQFVMVKGKDATRIAKVRCLTVSQCEIMSALASLSRDTIVSLDDIIKAAERMKKINEHPDFKEYWT